MKLPVQLLQAVKGWMRTHGWTEEHVAEWLHLSQSSVNRRFAGQTPWKRNELVILAAKLEMPELQRYLTLEPLSWERQRQQAIAALTLLLTELSASDCRELLFLAAVVAEGKLPSTKRKHALALRSVAKVELAEISS